MKTSLGLAFAVAGVLLGLGLGAFGNSNRDRLNRELEALRAEFAKAEQVEKSVLAEKDLLRDEVVQLRQAASEVHRLRAEVSQLKSRLSAVKVSLRRSDLTPPARAPEKRTGIREGFVTLESAPAIIRAVIEQEMGPDAVIKGVVAEPNKTGGLTFTAKGRTPDDRAVALRLAEDGSIL